MNIRKTRIQRGIFEIAFYIFIVILFGVILPIIGGLSLLGFQEDFASDIVKISGYLGSFLIYGILIIGALALIIFSIVEMTIIKDKEHPATQDKPSWARIFTLSYIYNPEDGFLWYLANKFKERKKIKWSTNIMRVVFLSLLVFLLMGILIAFNPQFAISGVPQTYQQVSPVSDVIFGAGIPAVAENGAFLFILFFLLGVVAYLTSKFVKNKELRLPIFFTIALIFIAPLMGFIWQSFHRVVYAHSEISLLSTFIFGWLSATLTILTGVFLFFFLWHLINNLVLKLLEVSPLGSDIAIYLGIAWFLIFITYISLEIVIWKRKKRKSQEMMITE